MTSEQLKEIEHRVEAATPGAWVTSMNHGCKTIKGGKSGTHKQAQYTRIANTEGLADEEQDRANAEFIAYARTDIPALIAEVKRLRELLGEQA